LLLLDGLSSSGELEHYHLLHAARAELYRRIDNRDEAAKSYTKAIALVTNDGERRYLQRRLHELT